MPTYEYACEKCGYRFEEFQSISAEPLTICPLCKGHVNRLISPGNGFLFKGSGFYITDYRSDSYKKEKENEKTPADSNDTKKSETITSEKKSSVSNMT